MDNHLSASALLIERLVEKTSLVKNKVRPAQSDDWVVKHPLDGSISVIFFDDQPLVGTGKSIADGKKQFSEQQWMIVLSTRNVADCGNQARQDIGTLMNEALKALQGFKLSLEHGELQRIPSPFRPTDDGKGFVHVSFLFSTVINTIGIGNERNRQ